MKREWTKKQAAEVLGITPRTIHYYTDEGLVTPEIANPRGKGTTRRYSAENLLEILVIRELVQFGITLSRIKQGMAMRTLNAMGLIRHPEFWNPEAKEGSLIPENPQSGTLMIYESPAKIRFYLVGYDVHADYGHFAAMTCGADSPINVRMKEYGKRYTTAVVVDVTDVRDKIIKLL
jgi:DNA-binding transcriptional MerR regulator